MSWSSLSLIFLFSIVLLSLYLLLNLNNSIVIVDLLFYEIEINLGKGLTVFFLIGSFITIILEIAYFSFKKRGKRNE
tara:strand:- start:213 stop:443 length:231 start_codon:yes stop_codon:yes gene_type:complete